MLGRYGPGKTTCATAACRMLAAERVTSRYYKAADLIDCYRHDCYRDGQEWSAWIKRLNSTARVLVLDEIETLRETDDERHTLARILDARYEALRPCVVVSNLAPADFEQQVGGRIADRLARWGDREVSQPVVPAGGRCPLKTIDYLAVAGRVSPTG